MRALVTLAAVALAAGVAPVPAAAAQGQPTSPAGQMAAAAAAYQQGQRDLRAIQTSLLQLDGQIATAQAQMTAADVRTAADRDREAALRAQVGQFARAAYQTRGSQLSAVLDARSISDVWNVLAEARVVAERQHTAVEQVGQLQQADEVAGQQARAARDALSRQRDEAETRARQIESRLTGLAQAVDAAGQVLGAAAGPVPSGRLPQTTGAAGQCTWYAEQAWVTYSEPSAPRLTGNGGDVVSNAAGAEGRPVESTPKPGSLVSWRAPLMSAFGHVAYVAAVDLDATGALTGYTVWEMNYTGPFQTDTRHVAWTGPSPQIAFLSPPKPVDPIMAEAAQSGG